MSAQSAGGMMRMGTGRGSRRGAVGLLGALLGCSPGLPADPQPDLAGVDADRPDAASHDAALIDAAPRDATSPDAALPDAQVRPDQMLDAAVRDAGAADAGALDLGVADAQPAPDAMPDRAIDLAVDMAQVPDQAVPDMAACVEAPESCNARDDDCDGRIDEIDAAACETGRPGICGPGRIACVGGAPGCVAVTGPAPEACNGIDDDCDGALDEVRPAPCDTGAPGICAEGQTACAAGAPRCDPVVAPMPEHCDGADDDCDGVVDEGIPPRPCLADDAEGTCRPGSTSCVDGFEVCAPDLAPGCEIPDSNLDEDCDGAIDERPDADCLPLDAEYAAVCLDALGQWTGLAGAIDAQNVVHLSHVDPVFGPWIYTRIDGAAVQQEIINPFITVLALDEVHDTDLVIWQGQPVACARNASTDRLEVVFREAGGWRVEVVDADPTAGADCALLATDDGVEVAYRRAGALWHGVRRGRDDWRTVQVDPRRAEGPVGVDLAFAGRGVARVIAHRAPDAGALRISSRDDVGWQTQGVPLFEAGGFRPSLDLTAEGAFVAHGAVPANPEAGSDVGLFLTSGPVGGPWGTALIRPESAGGGQGVLRTTGRTQIFAREHQRHPIFGDRDALVLLRDANAGVRHVIEEEQADQRRHQRLRFDAERDPFGLPTLIYVDYREAFAGEPVEDVVCLQRPVDGDGDAIPDVIEVRRGLDPANPDTDGDGRDDGAEVLVDGTDPLTP